MDIDALSEQTQETLVNTIDEDVHWNGRYVQEVDGIDISAIMRAFPVNKMHRSLHNCKIERKPSMSRPSDESEAEIKAGYDERRGGFIEGKWTWTWKDKDDSNSSAENGGNAAAPDSPDSRDRDFDKDVDDN